MKHLDFILYRTDTPKNNETTITRLPLMNQFLRIIENCTNEELELTDLYVPSIHLTSSSHPKAIFDKKNIKLISVLLSLHCEKKANKEIDYTKSYFTLRRKQEPGEDQHKGLVYHTFSDKVSTTSISYDVVTFYISFILVIGNVIRGVISGEAERIVLTEMPEPGVLINLCEGIKICRYRMEFERYKIILLTKLIS
jgi:hypothetical protein